MVPPDPTSRRAPGFVVPTPTFPFAPTNSAVVPEALLTLKQFPPPNCLTVSAFAETALPVTRTALEFMSVGTVGAPWLKLIEYYYLARFVCVTYSDGATGHTIANGSVCVVTSRRA
jgi:hypothetical protein